MQKRWLPITLAALAFLPAQAFALTMECHSYKAWHDDALKLEERRADYVVTSEQGSETFIKTVSKNFGVLIDAGVNDQKEIHLFVHDSISGIPVIIVDSMIFVPTCYQWDAKAPKAEVPASQMWFLSKKRWP